MTITEESRYQLFKRLEGTLGSDDANTLMEHLPPVSWADVATKTDLAHLQVITEAEFGQIRSDLVGLEERMSLRMDRTVAEVLQRQFVQTIASVAALLAAWSALAVVVGQFLVR